MQQTFNLEAGRGQLRLFNTAISQANVTLLIPKPQVNLQTKQLDQRVEPQRVDRFPATDRAVYEFCRVCHSAFTSWSVAATIPGLDGFWCASYGWVWGSAV